MKAILNICCAASFACVLWLATSDFIPSSPAAVASNPAGSGRGIAPRKAAAFSSHVRSKVVQYFDTYRNDPLGLPAASSASIEAGEIPAAWIASGIRAGVVVQASERSALVEVPTEVVRILPARQPSIRYFLAGSNLVAVDPGYKVVDSIEIPTVGLPDAADPESVQLVRHVDQRTR